jgi:LuxR family transcriptional regulator, maltose regulon positive regulatory protein
VAAWHRNDLARGVEHAEAAWRAALDSGSPWLQGVVRVAWARALVTQGEHEQAAAIMAGAHDIARRMGSRSNEYLCLVTEAEWALDRGDEAAAVGVVRRLMAIGRQQGYVNHPWWHPSVMARLCVLALEHDIEVEYVRQLVRRRGLVPEAPPVRVEHWPWAIEIRTLGTFEVRVDDRPIRFSGKTQRRPMELLKALVAFGGTGVREEQLADALWPDAEGDAAHSSLKITLHRLRRLLGHEEVIQRQDGRLTLDARMCWLDTWALQRDLSEAEETHGDLDACARLLERARALYRGPFLAGQEARPWAENFRERLRGRLLRRLRDLAQRWEQRGSWSHAVTWLERALELDDCAEETYRRLMLGYQRLGRRAEALEVYERCRRTLRAEWGVEPSPETAAVQRALRGSGPAGP